MDNQEDLDEKRTCPECKRSKPSDVFEWTHDRYGIPWKKVCDDCFDAVEDEIVERFEFDEANAGERLDEDY